MSVKGISTIVNNLRPDVKEYLDQLIANGSLESFRFHPSYKYPDEVTDQELWRHFGVFYDYLIKREIYFQLEADAIDKRAETYKLALEEHGPKVIENNQEVSEDRNGVRILINSRNIKRLKKLVASYENFKNIAYPTTDVLDDIFNTSMLHMMSYGNSIVPCRPEFLNWFNIIEVLRFVRSWNLLGIEINPTVGGNIFIGDADLIFQDSIMDMKLSKYDLHLNESKPKFNLGMYQMIFYALGYFIKTGQEGKTFKMYNPLLGEVYILNLENLKFYELSQVIDNVKKPCWKDV